MSSNAKKRAALGKGLSALLENASTDITSSAPDSGVVGAISTIAIEKIEANPFNPRTHFEKEALEELSQSIATHGIIQPLTVRKMGRDKYQLISGERRFRAAQLAGLKEVPAYVRIANDQAMLEMALVENIQREDLNAIEVALSYQRLIDECDLTQEQMSQKIAKSRSSITNHLRLLKLPVEVQKGVRDKDISMGHARALVSAGDEDFQIALYRRIVDEALSVRELEAIIRNGGGEGEVTKTSVQKPSSKETPSLNSKQETFCAFLSDKTSSRVEIKKTPQGSGKILINFNSEVDLNRVIEILNK
ncbi:MAG: ParB/RepB/Spo0J family partition protein [Bacteroidetes bacterium]|nr:MAG: ParB/RepB/Spo0J family partition protein [Bacteroidota bacterium]